jgi:hypothetical protein
MEESTGQWARAFAATGASYDSGTWLSLNEWLKTVMAIQQFFASSPIDLLRAADLRRKL